jgi:hypothetical protein
VQPTVPLDSKTHNKEMKSVDTDPANKHLVGETKYEITYDMTKTSEKACQMDVIKTHREEEEKNTDTKYVDTDSDKPQMSQVIDRRGDTDDAVMLANNDYQQTMYETSEQVEDADKKGEPNTQKRL